ncbi:MAG: CoA transferase [Novosphingobium sp.]|nr:CoA transferase [Novosphingobium sp.]
MNPANPATELPLTHCRIIDLSDERGLMAGHLLAQIGANVVQIEPPEGSPARVAAPTSPDGASLVWEAYAAGKRGVALALDTAEGRADLLKLVKSADVLIDSAQPGAMAALGLGHDDLKAINPGIIHASITAFGSDGPKADYAATDLIVWVSSGAVWPHRGQDGVPLKISADQAFRQAAIDAAGAILIALQARGETDAGQHIDISAQASCMLCTLSSHLAMAVGHEDFNALGGVQSSKLLDLSGSGARTRKTKWQLKDGLLEMHIGMGTAAGRFSNALFKWIDEVSECPPEYLAWDWVDVPRMLLDGELSADDLNGARTFVATVLERFTKAEMVDVAREYGLLLAPVMIVPDLLASPQLAARGFYAPLGDAVEVLPAPFAAGCFPLQAPLRPAPRIDEHRQEVFDQWLGQRQEPRQ